MSEKKLCYRCKKYYPITEFHFSKSYKDGHNVICKSCKKKENAERYASNKQYWINRADKYYFSGLLRKLSISANEYMRMMVAQNYRCALCGKQLKLRGKDTHVDHDHKTNRVRGILCFSCNGKIGAIENLEKENLLTKAIGYVGIEVNNE